jgi:hypothetical protein
MVAIQEAATEDVDCAIDIVPIQLMIHNHLPVFTLHFLNVTASTIQGDVILMFKLLYFA